MTPRSQSVATLTEMTSVRPILAGDPSRGALSLDTEANIKVGQYVQFFRSASRPSRTSASTSLAFTCDTEALQSESSNAFTGVSEHGFIVGKPGEQSWICSVQGSSAGLRL